MENFDTDKTFNLIMQIKSELELKRAFKTTKVKVSEDIINHYGKDLDIKELCKQKMIDILTSNVFNDYKTFITEEKTSDLCTELKLELFVLPNDMFKYVVEHLIVNMSDEIIQNIKNKYK